MARIIYLFKGGFPWDGRLVKICNSLQRCGNDVLIVSRWKGESEKFEYWNGLKINRACYQLPLQLSLPFPDNHFWIKDLSKIISEFLPEIIFVRDIFLVKAVWKALGKKSIPIIIDMAEHYPAAVRNWKKYNNNFVTKLLVHKLKIVDKWERESVSFATGIITVCEEQKERLVNSYGFNPDFVEIVHNTPELHFFRGFVKTLNYHPRIFLHHGYHTSEKPIDKFVEYFIEFARPNNGFRLQIAGPGECIPGLKSLVLARNANNVDFLGEYKFDELPNILMKADIGVIPYPANDFNNFTLHNKIFDFLACGIPILVSDAKPLRRLVEETKAGLSIQIERESIKDFFNQIDNYNWQKMSKNALEFSRKKYNWSVDEQNLIRFTKKVLDA